MYLHDWAEDGFVAMVKDFAEYCGKNPPVIAPDEVLLASYSQPAYEGYAFVLFQRDGKLYEVNASHCSCYGLEGQWEPEETSSVALRARMRDGELGRQSYKEGDFADELTAVLDEWDAQKAKE